MKCLVTGFEAFEGVEKNPTEEIVRSLPSSIGGVSVTTRVLPVEYGVVDRLIPDELYLSVDSVFMLGAAGEAQFGRLEAQAFNLCDSVVADNKGQIETSSVIEPGLAPGAVLSGETAIDALLTATDYSPMPWRRSEDPGRFVCNDSYFRMLHRASGRTTPCPTLFVHIPVPGRDDSVWAHDIIEESVRALLSEFLTLTKGSLGG